MYRTTPSFWLPALLCLLGGTFPGARSLVLSNVTAPPGAALPAPGGDDAVQPPGSWQDASIRCLSSRLNAATCIPIMAPKEKSSPGKQKRDFIGMKDNWLWSLCVALIVSCTGLVIVGWALVRVGSPPPEPDPDLELDPESLWQTDFGRVVLSGSCYLVGLSATAVHELVFTILAQPMAAQLEAPLEAVDVASSLHLVCSSSGMLWICLSQRCGMRILFLLAGVLHAVATFGLTTLPGLASLYASFILTGVASGVMYGAAIQSTMNIIPKKLRPIAPATSLVAFSATGIIMSYPLTQLTKTIGPKFACLVVGSFSTSALLACSLLLPSMGDQISMQPKNEDGETARETARFSPAPMRQPEAKVGFVVMVASMFAVYGINAFMNFLMEAQVVPIVEAGHRQRSPAIEFTSVIYIAAGLASQFVWCFVSFKMPAKTSLSVAVAFHALSAVTVGFLYTAPETYALLAVTFSALTSGAYAQLVPVLISRLYVHDKLLGSRIYGVVIAADCFGALSPPVSAWLAHIYGWTVVLCAGAVFLIVPFLLTVFVVPMDRVPFIAPEKEVK